MRKIVFPLFCTVLLMASALAASLYFRDLQTYFTPATSLLFDDAFMFIRYAKIWLLGHGEAWNMGEAPAYGNTSQLHFLVVLLITAFLDWPIEQLSALSSTLPAIAFLGWLPFTCLRHSDLWSGHTATKRYFLFLGLLFPLIYLTSPFGYHSGTGMDAMLSLFMHLLFIDATLSLSKQPERVVNICLVVITGYLAYLVRPDNLLVVLLFPFMLLGLFRRRLRPLIYVGVGLGLLLAADAAVKYLYFGDFLPLSYYSKKIGFLDRYGFIGQVYQSPFRTFFIFCLAIYVYLAVIILAVTKQNAALISAFLVPALCTLSYYFSMVALMNYGGRYFFPFLSYFLLCAVVVLPDLVRNFPRRAGLLVRGSLLVLTFAGFWLGDRYNYEIAEFFVSEVERCDDRNLAAEKHLERYRGVPSIIHLSDALEGVEPGLKIAMSEHGYFGAKNPQIHIIDLVGLHNHYLAHNGFNVDWFFAQAPDVIWAAHWQYTCLNSSIFNADLFWQQYELYPHLFSWGIALRKDSPHYPDLRRRLEEAWQVLYPGLDIQDYVRRSAF